MTRILSNGNVSGDSLDPFHRLRTDFAYFLYQIWLDRRLDKHSPLCPAFYDLCKFAESGPKSRIILAPRGLGKTHVLMILGLYRLFNDHDHKIIYTSKSETHAKKIVTTMRDWLRTVWFLQHLEPPPGVADSATRFQVGGAQSSVQPSVTAIGIDGQLEGNRAHSIFPDDIETDKNTITIESRESLDERTKEFKDILYPDIEGKTSEIVSIGTIHHFDTVYYKMADRGYELRTWPVAMPQKTDKVRGLAPFLQRKLDADPSLYTVNGRYQDRPVFARFNRQNIIEKMAEGQVRFFMQHMLIADDGKASRHPLSLRDLMVMTVDRNMAPIHVTWGVRDHNGSTQIDDIQFIGRPGDGLFRPPMMDKVWSQYVGTKAYIDPAAKGEDETALAIVSCLNGLYWVKCVVGLSNGAGEATMSQIVELLKQHGATDAAYEKNMDSFGHYGQLLETAIRKASVRPGEDKKMPAGWNCTLEGVHVTGQKESRIIGIIKPLLDNHRIVMDPSCLVVDKDRPREYSLQYQIANMTAERKCIPHNDKVDALAGCLARWEGATLDPSANRDAAEGRELKRQLRNVRKSLGRVDMVPNWMLR